VTPSFQRKVIYLALIAALLVPLSLISRPATTAVAGNSGSAGGKLAQLREDYKLGQAQVGQIDPTAVRGFPTAGFMHMRMHLDHLFSGKEIGPVERTLTHAPLPAPVRAGLLRISAWTSASLERNARTTLAELIEAARYAAWLAVAPSNCAPTTIVLPLIATALPCWAPTPRGVLVIFCRWV